LVFTLCWKRNPTDGFRTKWLQTVSISVFYKSIDSSLWQ
jgi:hypothetical protein